MDLYYSIFFTVIACFIICIATVIIVVLITIFNNRRLSRTSILSLNIFGISAMTVLFQGFLVFTEYSILSYPFLCKFVRLLLEYLDKVMPGNIVVLNIYSFIWMCYPRFDARKISSQIMVAIALSPHVVCVLNLTTLFATNVVYFSHCFVIIYSPVIRMFSDCIELFGPVIINSLFVITFLINGVSLYKKLKMREGAMQNALRRRIQIIIAVIILNILYMSLIEPEVYWKMNHHSFYFIFHVGHTLIVLWWPIMLPEARAFAVEGITSIIAHVKKYLVSNQKESSENCHNQLVEQSSQNCHNQLTEQSSENCHNQLVEQSSQNCHDQLTEQSSQNCHNQLLEQTSQNCHIQLIEQSSQNCHCGLIEHSEEVVLNIDKQLCRNSAFHTELPDLLTESRVEKTLKE